MVPRPSTQSWDGIPAVGRILPKQPSVPAQLPHRLQATASCIAAHSFITSVAFGGDLQRKWGEGGEITISHYYRAQKSSLLCVWVGFFCKIYCHLYFFFLVILSILTKTFFALISQYGLCSYGDF